MQCGGPTNVDMTFRATGDINTRRFVTTDAALTAGFGVKQAVAAAVTQVVIGISQDYDKAAPGLAGSTAGLAAASGDQLLVKGWGSVAMLELGTGGCAAWDGMVPDVNGKGVVASSNAGVVYNALALEPGAAGDFVRVLVLPPVQKTVI